jgi:hypothetical protein
MLGLRALLGVFATDSFLASNSLVQFTMGDLEKAPFRYSDTEANNRVS